MIKELIERIMDERLNVQIRVGKVKSVNADSMTCDIEIQNSPLKEDVRLRSVIDDNEQGILIYPKVGSYVLVGLIDNNPASAFIAQVSEVDKINFKIADIQLNGDALGGLIKINDLVGRLNKIEDAVNQLKGEFNGHTHISPPAPVSPVSTAPPTVPSAVVLANTTVSEIENEKVKHG